LLFLHVTFTKFCLLNIFTPIKEPNLKRFIGFEIIEIISL
jgi:hypothetical protein